MVYGIENTTWINICTCKEPYNMSSNFLRATPSSSKAMLAQSPILISAPSSNLSTPKFQNIPSPAFRQGGRGSKQVCAALAPDPFAPSKGKPSPTNAPGGLHSSTNGFRTHLYASHSSSQTLMTGSSDLKMEERKYVLFNGRQSPCFARVIKEDHDGRDSILLQPLRPTFLNPKLLGPWEGNLWSAKKSKTIEVKVSSHIDLTDRLNLFAIRCAFIHVAVWNMCLLLKSKIF